MAFQEVAEVVAVLQSLESQHEGVLGHEGHGEPAASGTFVNGVSHLGVIGENVNAQRRKFLLLGELPVLQPQVSEVVRAWLGGVSEISSQYLIFGPIRVSIACQG